MMRDNFYWLDIGTSLRLPNERHKWFQKRNRWPILNLGGGNQIL